MDKMELCQICGANFYNPAELHKHRMASHSENLLQCKICPVTTLGAKNLNNHMQTHAESPNNCPQKHQHFQCNENGVPIKKIINIVPKIFPKVFTIIFSKAWVEPQSEPV